MDHRHYILDDENRPVPCDDLERWRTRGVAYDKVGGRIVSTVFLGINHQFGDGPPLLFETMVFPNAGDFEDEECHRYSSWDDAVTGHQATVRRLKEKP